VGPRDSGRAYHRGRALIHRRSVPPVCSQYLSALILLSYSALPFTSIHFRTSPGEVARWLKAHAWKTPRSVFVSVSILRTDRRMDWLHRRRLEAGVARQNFPARRNEFPVSDHRELAATAVKRLGNSDPFSAGESDSGEFPCTFPAYQGTSRRDEFAPDCFHRHFVCGRGDFRRAARIRPRKGRDSAGLGR
jgi:hypothetical protein